MKGQTYTVFQMLVWAAFAMIFLVAVYFAYSFLTSYTPPVYLRQIGDLVADAWEGYHAGAREPVVAESVAFPGGAVITKSYIQNIVGKKVDVEFKCGAGFDCGEEAKARSSLKAIVSACCDSTKCVLYLNVPPPPAC